MFSYILIGFAFCLGVYVLMIVKDAVDDARAHQRSLDNRADQLAHGDVPHVPSFHDAPNTHGGQ